MRSGAEFATVTLALGTGLYDVTLDVTNGAGDTASLTKPGAFRVYGTDVFVSVNGTHVYPYTSYASGATNLIEALEAASDGTTVHMGDGWHRVAKTVSIARGIAIISDNGPEATTIFGKSIAGGSPLVLINHSGAVLSGLTISGKNSDGSQPHQWSGIRMTAAGGLVTNCVIRDHKTVSISVNGAGMRMEGGMVVDCVFSNNHTQCSGGGGMTGGGIDIRGSGALVDRCMITNNTVSYGGISYGGGVYINAGTIRNSLIVGNYSVNYGGGLAVAGSGKAFNCTVVRNTSGTGAAGIHQNGGTVKDCLVWNNTANGAPQDLDDPGFVDAAGGDYHLTVSSAAIDASVADGIGDLDLDHKPRVIGIAADRGCYEFEPGQFSIGISYDKLSKFAPGQVVFTAAASPAETGLDAAASWWTFDGTEPSSTNYAAVGTVVTNTFQPGLYTVRFKTVYDNQTYSINKQDWLMHYGQTVYLVASNEQAAVPYGTPETAATNLMQALAYVMEDSTLLIGDGTFRIAAEQTFDCKITIKSVNGPAATTIDGNTALRFCNAKHSGVVIDGIRFYRLTAWANGGAINMTAGLVTNCVFDTCRIQNGGGAGVYMTGGAVADCVFTNNYITSSDQRGVALSLMGAGALADRCTITASREDAGKTGDGAVYVEKGTLRNSLVTCNSLKKNSGIVVGDKGTAENCTVVSNAATTAGAYFGCNATAATAALRNLIIRGNVNSASSTAADAGGTESCYTHCAVPGGFGTACVTGDPLFRDAEHGNFRLRPQSPCVNAALRLDWMTGALDRDGQPRIHRPALRRSGPDIGCYECTDVLTGIHLIVR